jgi:hypothetical protein
MKRVIWYVIVGFLAFLLLRHYLPSFSGVLSVIEAHRHSLSEDPIFEFFMGMPWSFQCISAILFAVILVGSYRIIFEEKGRASIYATYVAGCLAVLLISGYAIYTFWPSNSSPPPPGGLSRGSGTTQGQWKFVSLDRAGEMYGPIQVDYTHCISAMDVPLTPRHTFDLEVFGPNHDKWELNSWYQSLVKKVDAGMLPETVLPFRNPTHYRIVANQPVTVKYRLQPRNTCT